MPTSQWHHNKGVIGHSFTLIIKSTFCTYNLYSCKIRSWSLRFRQFGECQVNTAQSSTLLHSCLVNKRAKFGTKILPYFWDVVIFVLGHFKVHPVDQPTRTAYTWLWISWPRASISLHGWGDTQWPINPPTTVLLIHLHSPPTERCKVSQQVWTAESWTELELAFHLTVTFLIRLQGPNDSLH